MAWKKPTALVKRFNFKERDFPRAGRIPNRSRNVYVGCAPLFGRCVFPAFSAAPGLFLLRSTPPFLAVRSPEKSIKVTAGPGGLPRACWAFSPGCRESRRGDLDRSPTALLSCPSWGSIRSPQTAKQPYVDALRWVGFHFQFLFPSSGGTGGPQGHLAARLERCARRALSERGAAPGGGARGLRVAAGGGRVSQARTPAPGLCASPAAPGDLGDQGSRRRRAEGRGPPPQGAALSPLLSAGRASGDEGDKCALEQLCVESSIEEGAWMPRRPLRTPLRLTGINASYLLNY